MVIRLTMTFSTCIINLRIRKRSKYMTDAKWNKLMEEARKESEKPGYGARCAAKRKAAGAGEFKKGNPQTLILS